MLQEETGLVPPACGADSKHIGHRKLCSCAGAAAGAHRAEREHVAGKRVACAWGLEQWFLTGGDLALCGMFVLV